jgi:uncharacterized protein
MENSIRNSYDQGASELENHSESPTTYSLNILNQSGTSFYDDLSNFIDQFLPVLFSGAQQYTEDYIAYMHTAKAEPFRSKNEYVLEFLIIGILWNEYSFHSQRSSRLIVLIASLLYKIRSLNSIFKSASDCLRGFLVHMLLHAPSDDIVVPGGKSFHRLILWLEATGEFTEETKRLMQWYLHISTFDSDKQKQFLTDCSKLAITFKSSAKSFLGKYTANIASFVKDVPARNRNSENRIFCGRSEIEYHMNMFAAEVMNRQFRDEFIGHKNKVVLLPTCMRKQSQKICKAYNDGETLLCARCNTSCTIHILSKKLAKHGVQCSLVPHSSDFSRFLKRWQNSTDTALVGVACVLNLLRGGYEMRRLLIASQCVFLDFSGCKKHWHSMGIPTSLNQTQLNFILGIDETE